MTKTTPASPQEHASDIFEPEGPQVPDYHAVGPTSGPPGQVADVPVVPPRGVTSLI